MKVLFLVALGLSGILSAACASPTLPSRDATIVVALLKKLDAPPRIAAVEEIMGPRDSDIGSGAYVLLFRMSDDSVITVSSVDGKTASRITHTRVGSAAETIFSGGKTPNQSSQPTPRRG